MTTVRGPAAEHRFRSKEQPATASKGAYLAADVVPKAENPTPVAQNLPALDVLSAFASRSESLALSRGWRRAAFGLQSEPQRAREATPRQ